jgi:CDP-diacylglycerol--glycerol-3-phosphate 3-phosphatidyltransferase
MISNAVTSIRILLLPALFFMLLQPSPAAAWGALAVFLLAGLTDVIDGRLARALNEVSAVGAMLDLVADRLLTLTVLIGLIAAGRLEGWVLVAGIILIARDLVVASFGEAVSGLGFKVSNLEKVKITLQFVAFGLLIAPGFFAVAGMSQRGLGGWALEASAVLTIITVVDYGRRTAARLRMG